MAQRPPIAGHGDDDSGAGPPEGQPPGMPRWLKVSGLIVMGLVLLLLALQVAGGGGGHGPRRHGGASAIPETMVESAAAADTSAFGAVATMLALGREGTLIVDTGGHAPHGGGRQSP